MSVTTNTAAVKPAAARQSPVRRVIAAIGAQMVPQKTATHPGQRIRNALLGQLHGRDPPLLKGRGQIAGMLADQLSP